MTCVRASRPVATPQSLWVSTGQRRHLCGPEGTAPTEPPRVVLPAKTGMKGGAGGAARGGCRQAGIPDGREAASCGQGPPAPGPLEPGRAWVGGGGGCRPPPRSPGTSRVTVCTAGRAAPRVIYDPLPLAGGSGGSGLGPAAEGPERGDRAQRRRRRGPARGRGPRSWRRGCGRRRHLLCPLSRRAAGDAGAQILSFWPLAPV